ncbi:hypothetical protein DPSP01_008649 [Paraphaeosphaeria sporulosa]|uniref:Protein kinase domain-containing protein n=1 Tax=Paraphaeosphaeria sporulosa TaxID=1460663 RepID=A0A177BX62_9PLEO|nr:uncharacterized protein CC84DRAFT_1222975 [Paraphaeosphaeria sporulosa]OAF99281.1 hypothetical protein CC84DRAFT_1222975 [Paraphaeosphaeria sporulosa]
MAEVGLAAVATVDLALKYGKQLVQLCSDFQHADEEVRERKKKIKSTWVRTEKQIDFLGKIWNSLDVELQNHQSELLDELVSKLDAATKQIMRVRRKTVDDEGAAKVNRMKYAAIKGSIDKAIDELKEWQRDFDPGWFLTMKIAQPVIDRELAEASNSDSATPIKENKSAMDTISTARNVRKYMSSNVEEKLEIFRKHDNATELEPIPYSAARTLQRTGKGGSRSYIVDTVPCLEGVNVDILTKDVRELARKLSVADPFTFGLLQCRGVVKIYGTEGRKPTAFDFIFQIPSELHSPRSLRATLLNSGTDASLTSRVQIARKLAQSVSYVHTYGFVHKNIRPDTILVLQDTSTELAASFLLGFERFRNVDRRTLMMGDSVWNKDLYRHPQRQGLNPEEEYVMQHDIYSLGVCLLEIGLWQSFFLIMQTEEATPTGWLPKNILEDSLDKAACVKEHFVELAQDRLPAKMGEIYTRVVVTCLTCLDKDNVDFGDAEELEDEDGVLVGVRFIEKILRHLNSISV